MKGWFFLGIIIVLLTIPIGLFKIVDDHIESSVTHVNGTFEKECSYYSGFISNSSDPWPWIQVDGKQYIARKVDFDRFGDVGDSLIGRFEKGDPVDMDLFPYRPYNTWNDTPTFWIILFMPWLVMFALIFRIFVKGDLI